MSSDDQAKRIAALERRVAELEKQMKSFEEFRSHAMQRTAQVIEQQNAEIETLSRGFMAFQAVKASADELYQMYESARAVRPSLQLKQFLETIGASHRYRSIVNQRSRRKQREGR